MRRFFGLLLLLFVVETWGVYGAWQAKRVTRQCKLEVGPLCYYWEPNALGKIIGEDQEKAIEGDLKKMRDAWEDNVADRLKSKKPDEIKKALEDVAEKMKHGFENLKDKASEAIEK